MSDTNFDGDLPALPAAVRPPLGRLYYPGLFPSREAAECHAILLKTNPPHIKTTPTRVTFWFVGLGNPRQAAWVLRPDGLTDIELSMRLMGAWRMTQFVVGILPPRPVPEKA